MLIFSVSLAFFLAHHANNSGIHIFGIANPSAIVTLVLGVLRFYTYEMSSLPW